jgi:hypothetical protein
MEQLQRERQPRNKKESQLQNQGQNLLQQRPSPSLQSQPLQPRPNSSQIQFKSVIKSQNEQSSPTTPSLSIKSFHLPDVSLSQQSDVRNFRQMNFIENSVKGPVAALRTLTDNYRQLELDKQKADVKVDQLEKQLEQYRQLLRKEQSKGKANNKHSEIEPITYGVEDDFKKSSSHGKIPLIEKESKLQLIFISHATVIDRLQKIKKSFYIVSFTESNPSMISLQKKYKAMRRQLEYMKTYARKAEDERDEAKKALIKTHQDIAQMNDQFENLRASVQIPNKGTQLSKELPMNPIEKTNELSNINSQENNQIIEPKETRRDSGSEKSKSCERVDVSNVLFQIVFYILYTCIKTLIYLMLSQNKLGKFRRKLRVVV